MKNPLADLPDRHYRDGVGVYSICSAHPVSLEAGAVRARTDDSHLLIEATSNQVDQFGGYTGMTPAAFRQWVESFVANLGVAPGRLILGGDHLGPNPWRREPAEAAMDKARELVRQYAAAGFIKIHLDCSMSLGGDSGPAPSQETVAGRAADLCRVSEEASRAAGGPPPVYVIGTEVPVPGGVTHEVDGGLEVTRVGDARETLDAHRRAFAGLGLEGAWERVIALVVQPGVEFGNYSVAEYDASRAAELSGFIESESGERLLFEAHSTDYQMPGGLEELVRDHFAVLKVGPWLTYAYRRALFGLAAISWELGLASNVRGVIGRVMDERPEYWRGHYHGTDREVAVARLFSLSDRIRYYWPDERIQAAVRELVADLGGVEIPLSLVEQYLPGQYAGIREKRLVAKPHDMLLDAVVEVLTHYARAVGCCRSL